MLLVNDLMIFLFLFKIILIIKVSLVVWVVYIIFLWIELCIKLLVWVFGELINLLEWFVIIVLYEVILGKMDFWLFEKLVKKCDLIKFLEISKFVLVVILLIM